MSAMGDNAHTSASSSSSSMRVYGPRDFEDESRLHRKQDEIRSVVAKIAQIHDKANLNTANNDDGLCFGLFDPATNILINSVISSSAGAPPPPPLPPRAYAGRRRRRREWEKNGLLDGDDDDDDASRARAYAAQRSFDGLVAFLTGLFPYLPDAEALAYLAAADLDPLVAALLVVRRRGVQDHFDLCSPTTAAATEVALRCAAAAAMHPDPRWLVRAWKKVLSSPAAMAAALAAGGPAPPLSRETMIDALKINLNDDDGQDQVVLELKRLWDLAKGRFAAASSKICDRLLPPVRGAMKRMLLATIHGHYVAALGRLPAAELPCRYHRGLLLGGYCYGPLDPVSNIIVNTVWYEQRFPTGKQVSVSMLSTQMLWRVAARSMYGLISFLCTRHRGLSPDEALQRLLVAGADLQAADDDCSVFNDAADSDDPAAAEEESTRVASVFEAYNAAVTAAFPSLRGSGVPLAHPEFLAHHQGWFQSALLEVLQTRNGRPLSSQDMSSLEMILQSTGKSHDQQHDTRAPTKVKNIVYYNMIQGSNSFWGKHERVTTMVRDALDKFNKTVAPEDRLFELHIIFGFNEFVSGPVHSKEKVGGYNPWTPEKYCHTHINFLAICKDRPYDSPTIFFAECGKDGADTCWCVPIIPQKPKAEQPRCVYCEHHANRIVHPTVESFYGRDEFDTLFYKSDRQFYTNNENIRHSRLDINWVHGLEDGAVYLNYYPDGDDGDKADWVQIS